MKDMEAEYKKAFGELNDEQRKAVETINGPLLVIAGPGTGKTQLLALRAAEILRRDSTMLPSNILCLTFTDNAADNMRRRLSRYIGQDAYQVAIHTFNSFGSYIMNAYPEYFYEWREMQTADELTAHNLLEEILGRLPGNHVLAARGADGTFYGLRQIKNLISDAKKNNLSAAELKEILAENAKSCGELVPLIREYWPDAMNRGRPLEDIEKFLKAVRALPPASSAVTAMAPLRAMFLESLELAAAQAEELAGREKTKPFTAWKDEWLARDADKDWTLKAMQSSEKLMAGAEVYAQYQQALEARGLVDFNDQIVWVLRTLEENDALRYNLQERFQYVMIDEFQDTNRAQLLLAQFITDAPEHEGRPNIMVVGDDDQAIFRFQGADIGNVEVFSTNYERPEQITLIKNYRSTQAILTSSRKVSRQISLSLEKQRKIVKDLVATVKAKGTGVSLDEFDNEPDHYGWVADEIKRLLDKGETGGEIAVLARERKQLDELLPYLRVHNIAIDYERSENVLEQAHVLALLDMARLVLLLSEQRLEEANALLPRIISEPMWGIKPVEIWQVAQAAYSQKRFWLDVIFEQKGTGLRRIADFLVDLASRSSSLPAEQVLDELIGTGPAAAEQEQEDEPDPSRPPGVFVSPYKKYFFGEELLKDQPGNYLTLLSHLSTLRRQLRNYQTGQNRPLSIRDLVEFVDSYMRAETLRMLDTSPHRERDNAVKLMTVHKAKGLEFDHVFVISLENSSWTRTGRSSRFSYPNNLLIIKPADNDYDDSLRLLFVAMTRARHDLRLSYYLKNESDRAEQPFGPLLALDIKPTRPETAKLPAGLVEQYEQRWLNHHQGAKKGELKAYLTEELERYQLSSTHLNNFLDVGSGGPMYFMTQNLLHFPASMNAHAVYGDVVHKVLRLAHEMVISGGQLNIEKIIQVFSTELLARPMARTDHEYFLKKGEESLRFYLEREAGDFDTSQVVEFDFKDQGVVVNGARLKGFIDRMDFDKQNKTIIVSDYKTGSSAARWQIPPSAKEYERLKIHRYRQQLLFYKLLVDNSAEWGRRGWPAESGIIRFIEPEGGRLRTLPLIYDSEEVERFKKLVAAVWQRIQSLDFPAVSGYEPNLSGSLRFEEDLISGSAK